MLTQERLRANGRGTLFLSSVHPTGQYSTWFRRAKASGAGGVPAKVVAAAASSLGEALRVAARVGGRAGEALVTAAKTSFIQGMDRGLVVGTAVALLGALVSLIWLPAWAPPVDAGEGPPQAIDEGWTSPAEAEREGAMKA